ncbi:MAG: type VI secretion system baseplate subunit TssF [Bacteroidetes bacterium]|nr:type VI secretion system baseplate subunit TssF [Bacteroidota bacterium]
MAELENEYLSKEAIKSRMFKNAARFWGYADADMDAFDPLVRLMIEACAVESYKINNDIISSDVRVMEKMASMLTPDVFTSALPSHSIVHTRCVEKFNLVDHNFHLRHQKKVASKANGPLDSNIDIYYSPAGHYKTYDGAVAALVIGNSAYKINNFLEKEFVAKSSKPIENNTAWVGLALNDSIKSLDKLSFYFDFKNHPDKESLYKILCYSRWSYNGTPLQIKSGITNYEPIDEEVLSEFELTNLVKRNTNDYYNNRFISIDDEKNVFERNQYNKQNYPESLKSVFNESDLNKLNKPLIWFKINFPAAFDSSTLDEMFIYINAYPILNLHYNEIRYRLQSYFNIVLLECNEQFFAVRRVSGIDDIDYISKPATENLNDLNGTYSLRAKGVQRFDSRNATEHLNYLLELLRDESSAFAAFGQEFIASNIRDLNQSISLIEQRVKQSQKDIFNLPSYLFVRPRETGENINVEFWSTNGNDANNIRPGSKIDTYKGIPMVNDSVQLLTHTTGGRNKLSQNEELNVYRDALLTRGRIVTNEDIRSFCFHYLNDKISDVEVRKGVTISKIPSEGLINTLDVYLEKNIENGLNLDEWKSVITDLEIKLQKNSVVFTNYRIFIKENIIQKS